ncbi:MAG: cation:H+ antiporter [Flavobacteriaceae bacterium]|jgi:cation:H+ antiporter
MIIFWISVFIASLFVLVKGSDWLLGSAEKIGLRAGLSPFVVGVVIVGLGTSFPELVSSLIAVFQGAPEIVVANALGSNIANILLVVGLAAVIGGRMAISKNLIDLELPLLAISTVLFLGVVWDGIVTIPEAIILLLGYVIYLLYTIKYKDDEIQEEDPEHQVVERPRVSAKDILFLILGVVGLVIGAKYLVNSIIKISEIFNIATGIISITAVAFGTSLPELLVSIKAARSGKTDVALGNIFGSNIFNILVVVGIPALFATLPLDEPTMQVGVPALAVVTLLFVISGISKRIHIWEGAFYLLAYILFAGKLFGLL